MGNNVATLRMAVAGVALATVLLAGCGAHGSDPPRGAAPTPQR
jgi:hypothetical protein